MIKLPFWQYGSGYIIYIYNVIIEDNIVQIVDLEFSETLELDRSVSGGFGSSKDTPIDFNQDIDVELLLDFDVEFVEIDSLDGVVVTPGTDIIETGMTVPPGCRDNPCYIGLVNDAGIPIEVTGTLVGAVG